MQKKRFNDNWIYEEGDGSALGKLFGARNTEVSKVTLPHDASIRKERFSGDAMAGGNGFFVESTCNYSKDFYMDSQDSEKVVWLEFEGVYQNAFIYVNNSYVGKHPYGYSNFYLDITRYLIFGAMNHIQVVVKNGIHSGRWYTGSGIYRDVNILIAEQTHFIPDGIHLTTMELEQDLAVVDVDAVVENVDYGVKGLRFCVRLMDANGRVAAELDVPITLQECGRHNLHQRMMVRQPENWSVDRPYLYRYSAELYKSGADKEEMIDCEEGTFGIRKLQLDPVHGLRINGQTVKLRGGCVHHDNGLIGAASFECAEERKVRKLKEAGYNAIRSAHNPISRGMLDACDRLGMLIMDELSDVWTTTKVEFDYGVHFAEWWEQDVVNMVNKDYNHPSVILYSIGNEIPETGNKFDTIWGKRIAEKIRSLDSGRYLVNSVNLMLSGMDHIEEFMGQEDDMSSGVREINTMMTNMGEAMGKLAESELVGQLTEEAFSHVDIAGYNYAAGRYQRDGERYPNRILMGSETYPATLDRNWALVEKMPYVVGDFSWTAWDYLGEAGIGNVFYGDGTGAFSQGYPWKAAYCADFDLTGNRRPVSYWREIIWGLRKRPYIAVCPPEHFGEKRNPGMWGFTDAIRSWNWNGYEERPVCVEVYSDAAEVELFLNDRSVGRCRTGQDKKAVSVFETIYETGCLEVVAYDESGNETGRDRLETADPEVELSVSADRTELCADGQDLAYIDIELRDSSDRLNPTEIRNVSIEVEGAGVLLGYGSADPKSEENYFDTEAKTFQGRLSAVIRTGTEPGIICIRVKAEGCREKCLELSSGGVSQ